jgi:hypothetical protein
MICLPSLDRQRVTKLHFALISRRDKCCLIRETPGRCLLKSATGDGGHARRVWHPGTVSSHHGRGGRREYTTFWCIYHIVVQVWLYQTCWTKRSWMNQARCRRFTCCQNGVCPPPGTVALVRYAHTETKSVLPDAAGTCRASAETPHQERVCGVRAQRHGPFAETVCRRIRRLQQGCAKLRTGVAAGAGQCAAAPAGAPRRHPRPRGGGSSAVLGREPLQRARPARLRRPGLACDVGPWPMVGAACWADGTTRRFSGRGTAR